MSMEKLCRLCMGRSNLIHSVLDDNFLQKIAICVSILINPMDKMLPLDLCALCALKVKDFFEFRQNCLKVQQLLEQDVCSRNVLPVQSIPISQSPPSTRDALKQETNDTKSQAPAAVEITKFEVFMDEDERLSDIQQDVEQSLEEPDQVVEQLEEVADEDVFVEDLVEQDEVLSETGQMFQPEQATETDEVLLETGQTVELKQLTETYEVLSETEQTVDPEQATETDIQSTDTRDMGYEVQMMKLNFNQNALEPGVDEAVEDLEDDYSNQEMQFVEFVQQQENEDPVQESTAPESSVQTSLPSNSAIRQKRDPHASKPERNEKEIYRSLLQKCDTCGKSVERNRMEGHRNRHRGVRPYKCKGPGCDMAFYCKVSRRLHTRNRHGTVEFKCEFCEKVYFSKRALYYHKQDKHTEKNFACADCGLSFVSNARLNRHMVIHEDVHEFKCPHCPKEFYRSNNLKVHLRSHTKEKPFCCFWCDKAFGYPRLLREHVNRHHKDHIDPQDAQE